MKKLIIIFTLLSVVFSCSSQTPNWARDEAKKIKKGNKIVKKVEKYKRTEGKLPANLGDIHVKEALDGPFYYERIGKVNYMVWFGTTLGEGVYYFSDNKKWENRLRGMSKD